VALWTPANLAVAPKVWWDGDQAVFSGSNLSAWANTGAFGGSASVHGPPTKAAALNGHNGVTAAGTAQNLTQSMAFGASGAMFAFAVANLSETAGGATHGLFSDGNGVVPTGSVAVYLSVGDPGGGIFAGANGYGGSPNLGGFPATFAAGARLHGIQLGSTNGHWVDGAPQALSDDAPAAVPTYSTPSTWVYLDSFNPNSGEQLNGSLYQFLLLDYFPTAAERQRLEGWAAWQYGLQANLPGGHPFSSAAPQVYSLPVTVGAFAGTGVAAMLRFGRKAQAAKGAFALAGVAANLTYRSAAGFTLTAARGAFAETGAAVTLRTARKLANAKGTIAYSGAPAGLVRGRFLAAAAGAFALAGKPVAFGRTFGVAGEVGAFTLAAGPASFVYRSLQPWIPTVSQPVTWTTRSEPSQAWTPVAPNPGSWS
jgi:hypothetical protein